MPNMIEKLLGGGGKAVPMPPWQRTEAGAMRRLGLEFEFSGLSLPKIAAILAERLDGKVEIVSDYENRISGPDWGDFGIELDFAYLKELAREDGKRDDWIGDLTKLSEDLLGAVAKQVVPFEVVTPPIPFDELAAMDGVIDGLREAGARGTRHSPIYAFGLHLNPELPDLSAETLACYLKAWVCLYDWLRERCEVDLSRRVSPYIEPYPRAYAVQVLDPDYWPDREQLIDDYLAHNPTRNRALDLLPAFCAADEPRVRKVVEDRRVKARPALHYRLPNCQIDDADWSWRRAWLDWLQVEHLAADRERLTEFGTKYREFLRNPVERLVGDWVKETYKWLLDASQLHDR